MLDLGQGVIIPDGELTERFFLASGPGGQNINKVATAVRLSFHPAQSPSLPEEWRLRLLNKLAAQLTRDGALIVTAREFRTRQQNRDAARLRLELLLKKALITPKKRRPTKPGRAAVQRRLDEKKKRAATKIGRGKIDY